MDVPRRLGPRADLRVGDADRQNVVAELQRHFIDGRLTSDELGERVDEALRSKTFGELGLLIADLPTLADPAPTPTPEYVEHGWLHSGLGVPIGAIFLVIGIVSMLWMFAIPGGHHFGGFGIWPIFIWGFFLFGRPPRSGGRRGGSHHDGPPARYQ